MVGSVSLPFRGQVNCFLTYVGNLLSTHWVDVKEGIQGLSEGKKFLFSGKFSVLCFLVTSVLRFALLPYQQFTKEFLNGKLHFLCSASKSDYSGRSYTSKIGT